MNPIIQFQVITCTNVIVLIFVAYGDVNDKVTTNKWPFVKSSCYSSIGPIVFDDEIGDFFVYKFLLGFPYFWENVFFLLKIQLFFYSFGKFLQICDITKLNKKPLDHETIILTSAIIFLGEVILK